MPIFTFKGGLFVTKDLKVSLNCHDYWTDGYFDDVKFKDDYTEITYLNDFINLLISEKMEFNLNEMLIN